MKDLRKALKHFKAFPNDTNEVRPQSYVYAPPVAPGLPIALPVQPTLTRCPSTTNGQDPDYPVGKTGLDMVFVSEETRVRDYAQ